MKAIIFTLAVAGFMSSANAGLVDRIQERRTAPKIYKPANDPKVHNMKTQECAHKQSGSLFAKTAAKKDQHKQKSRVQQNGAVQ